MIRECIVSWGSQPFVSNVKWVVTEQIIEGYIMYIVYVWAPNTVYVYSWSCNQYSLFISTQWGFDSASGSDTDKYATYQEINLACTARRKFLLKQLFRKKEMKYVRAWCASVVSTWLFQGQKPLQQIRWCPINHKASRSKTTLVDSLMPSNQCFLCNFQWEDVAKKGHKS